MKNLEQALTEIGLSKNNIINVSEVTKIDGSSLWVGRRRVLLSEFKKSFIRYPYDLIPPFTATYRNREAAEYFKTVALLLDHVSVNPLASTWMLRNRAFSLKEAASSGADVAEFVLQTSNSIEIRPGPVVLKSIGNCFVTENESDVTKSARDFLVSCEDDGDLAVIFPASLVNFRNVSKYLKCFGYAFLQKSVNSDKEFRVYLVDDDCFTYIRDDVPEFDKSAARYFETDYDLSCRLLQALHSLRVKYGLGYMCFDVILDRCGKECVIDVNPYGSMPCFDDFPEVSIALAKVLMA